MSEQLMAVVAEGARQRHYLAPTDEHYGAARVPRPDDAPEAELAHDKMNIKTPLYGMKSVADLFTPRQLTALTTFSDLVGEARDRIQSDAISAGMSDNEPGLEADGDGAAAYADSVALYLGLTVGRQADRSSSLNGWDSSRDTIRNVFARQALPMVWDFAESNPLGSASGSYVSVSQGVFEAIDASPAGGSGVAQQADAASRNYEHVLVATDPPYYDNIGYANLSDFFYGWLRRSLIQFAPALLATVQTPKADELVADPYRHGGKERGFGFLRGGF